MGSSCEGSCSEAAQKFAANSEWSAAADMSDEEYENTSNTSRTSKKGDEAFARAKAGMKQSELNESLKDYINEWRNQRAKEEEELKRLKEKQVKRKEIRT